MSSLITRPLGNTDITLTELTMGTWGLCAGSYGPVFEEQREHALSRAVELGVRSFDMAPCWGPDGLSERAVAKAVSSLRNESVYITRAGKVPDEYGWVSDFSAQGLRSACEGSLARLATDRIDVWLMHNPSEEELRSEELRNTVEALVNEGKVRVWGASVSHEAEARAALEVGAKVLCVPFSLLAPRAVWDLEAACMAHKAGVLARSTLMYGVLSGRILAKRRFPEDDHRAQRWLPEALNERVRQANDLKQAYVEAPRPLTAIALRWVLAHETVTSAVIGPRTALQVENAVSALEGDRPLMGSAQLEIFRSKLMAG